LGGLDSALTMLESPKPSVQESALMVIANCTQSDEDFCLQLMKAPLERLQLLLGLAHGAAAARVASRRHVVAGCDVLVVRRVLAARWRGRAPTSAFRVWRFVCSCPTACLLTLVAMFDSLSAQ
jgi:hypothetical protein